MEFRKFEDYKEDMEKLYSVVVSSEMEKLYMNFIGDRNFVIDVSEDCEDNLLIVDEKYYWCKERFSSVKFVELSNDEIASYWME